MPSGGSEESDLYSLNRRLAAGFDIVDVIYSVDVCGVGRSDC